MKDVWLCNLQGGPDPQVEKHRSKFSTRSHQRGEKHGRSSVRTGVTPLLLVALLEIGDHWAECFPHSKFLRSVYARLTHLFSWQPYEVDMIAVTNASEKSNDVLRLIRILLRKQNEKTSSHFNKPDVSIYAFVTEPAALSLQRLHHSCSGSTPTVAWVACLEANTRTSVEPVAPLPASVSPRVDICNEVHVTALA